MKLEKIRKQSVLLLGFAQEGKDSLDFLKEHFPEKKVAVADEKKLEEFSEEERNLLREKVDRTFLGKRALPAVSEFEVVVKSPGFPPRKVEPRLREGQTVTSQSDIFLQNAKGTVVGVTGSLGKSTTATLIYEIFKKAGKKVFLLGNIGRGALSFLAEDNRERTYIYELSSYQLRTVRESPEISVLLNIFREHLDWHPSMDDYISSKARITAFQEEEDLFIYNRKNKKVRKVAQKTKAKKIPIAAELDLETKGVEVPLRGKFNLLNVRAALEVARALGVEQKTALKAVERFEPLPHRLEYVGEFEGLEFYNDSLSTVPEATLKALEALKGKVETLVLGGYDRGQVFTPLVEKIVESSVRNIVLFPPTGRRLKRKLEGRGFNLLETEDMGEAVDFAFLETKKGAVLLSPASPSFGIFSDYKERGEVFKDSVKNHVQKKKKS